MIVQDLESWAYIDYSLSFIDNEDFFAREYFLISRKIQASDDFPYFRKFSIHICIVSIISDKGFRKSCLTDLSWSIEDNSFPLEEVFLDQRKDNT